MSAVAARALGLPAAITAVLRLRAPCHVLCASLLRWPASPFAHGHLCSIILLLAKRRKGAAERLAKWVPHKRARFRVPSGRGWPCGVLLC